MNKRILIAVIVLAIAIGTVFALVSGNNKSGDSSAAAPDFTLTDQYGKEHTLSDYKGKVVFINFWATWCPPCVNELPVFEQAYKENGSNKKDFVILGVYAPGYDKEGTSEEVRQFFKEQGLTYPILADTEAKVFSDYAISGLPTTVMIDKNGKEATRNTGEMNSRELKEMIDRVSKR